MELILIEDAGHAGFGVTPGKRTPDGKMYEWEFNDAVRKYVHLAMLQFENVKVYTVSDPTGKRDVPLKERTDKANAIYQQFKDKAKVIYISYHANAYGTGWNGVKGIETFVYPSRTEGSVKLASAVHKKLIEVTGLSNRGIKSADFHVLRETKMDSILIEGGFMTNKHEAALLKSTDYRIKFAAAIVVALEELYNLKPKGVVKVAQDQSVSTWAKDAHAFVTNPDTYLSDGTRPKDPVTREEQWVMMLRLFNLLSK